MKSINFNTAMAVEYCFNGDENKKVKINLTPGVINSVSSLFDGYLESISDSKKEYTEDEANAYMKELCDKIDMAFGADVCKTALGDSNPLSITASGRTLFEEFFESFMSGLMEDIKGMKDSAQPRPEVQKYLNKPADTSYAALAKPYELTDTPDINRLSKEDKIRLFTQLLS